MNKLLPVYIKVRGGLGNQLSFLAEGLTLALGTKRKLWMDMRFAGSANNRSSLKDSIEDFKFISQNKIQYINENSTIKNKIICNLLRTINTSYYFFGIYKVQKFKYFTYFLVNPKHHFEGNSARNILSNIEFFQSVTLRNPSKFYLELENVMLKRISIHYRYGDYEKWHSGMYLIQPDRYIELINELYKANEGFEKEVWIFTDDILSFQSKFKTNLDIKIISSNKLSPSEELFLLSKSSYIIGSNSTFSFWACVFHKSLNSVYVPANSLTLPGWNVYS